MSVFTNPIFHTRETDPSINHLADMNRELDQEVKTALADKIAKGESASKPDQGGYVANELQQSMLTALSDLGLDPRLIKVQPPTDKKIGNGDVDIALNMQRAAGVFGRAPSELAEDVKSVFGSSVESVGDVDIVGPFVNIKLDYSILAPKILGQVEEFGENYGHQSSGNREVVVIDFSSPNVAKNMTVAHLRSTVIGMSLLKIQEAVGNTVFGINHIGDWGTQFGGIIYQYQKELAENGDEFLDEINNDPTGTLMRIYRKFNDSKTANPDLDIEAQRLFLDLENGDPELVELWKKFREWSLRDFGPVYERLGIEFDAIQGESFYESRMAEVVRQAIIKGVLVEREDGSIVFPSQDLQDPETGKVNEQIMKDQTGNPRDEIIVKPSGGTVYLTRDLAAIYYRALELSADKILYVIGKEQKNHCIELFSIARQMGITAVGSAKHISFGHINVDGRKMKSREGKVVLLKDMLDLAGSVAEHKMAELGKENLSGSLTEIIGLGSIVFMDLAHDREKDIEFGSAGRSNEASELPDSQEDFLDNYLRYIQKNSGASKIQYTHARINSLLENAQIGDDSVVMPEIIAPEEKRVLFQILMMPTVVEEAARSNKPHVVANYLLNFCKLISELYSNVPVIDAENKGEREFRIRLLNAARQVISNSAALVQLKLPERM